MGDPWLAIILKNFTGSNFIIQNWWYSIDFDGESNLPNEVMALFLEENRKKLVPPERVDSSKPYDDHMSQFFFLCHRRFEEVSQDTHALHRAGSRGAKNFSFFFVIAHFSAFFPNFMITIWISIIKTNAFSVHIYTFKSKYIALLVNKIFLLL